MLEGWGRGEAPILHNKPMSFFSVFFFLLFFPHIQFSIGRLHCSHNANHSWSLFMHWLICKDSPSSSNSQQRRNITASRVILNLSVQSYLHFLIQHEETLWDGMHLWIIYQNPTFWEIYLLEQFHQLIYFNSLVSSVHRMQRWGGVQFGLQREYSNSNYAQF